MDVREKLVELLKTNACPSPFMCDPTCKYYGFGDCFPDRFADYLIAHGVTVQEWLSIDDRLPEDSATVLVCHKNGLVTTNAWLGAHWWFENERNPITHWMPLPEPPKGE